MADGGIEYDNGGYTPTRRQSKGGGGLVGLMVRAGFAKDEQQANTALIVILVIAIVIGVGIWFIK